MDLEFPNESSQSGRDIGGYYDVPLPSFRPLRALRIMFDIFGMFRYSETPLSADKRRTCAHLRVLACSNRDVASPMRKA